MEIFFVFVSLLTSVCSEAVTLAAMMRGSGVFAEMDKKKPCCL